MSAIGNIHLRLCDIIDELFPNKAELQNFTELFNNDDFILKDGYGLQIGTSENSGDIPVKGVDFSRTFSIVLTRKTFDLDRKSDSKRVIERAMLEDMLLVIVKIKKDRTLKQNSTIIEFVGDEGFENFLSFTSLKVTFKINYLEMIDY